ncbi:MAG TPA: DUF456 family protein [Thermoanaerobaculia bacterium]|jgi:hypothetical protein|nr:DUF456 family protein [Thermoanaerobaculia bacterium]
MEPLLWVLAIALVLVGIAGAVLPALPGVPLVFVGLLLAAWIDGFQKVGWVTMTILGLLTLFSFALDFLATSLGAKKAGASKLAIAGGALGALVGLFFAIPGLILGPFVGAFLGELVARRGRNQAVKSGLGTWLGLVVGTAGRLALIVAMVAIFVTAYMI